MKKLIIAATAVFFLISAGRAYAGPDDEIVHFPDSLFKHFLVHYGEDLGGVPRIDKNRDEEIQVSEARGFTEKLFITTRFDPAGPLAEEEVTDLTGIEEFKNIPELSITGLKHRNNIELAHFTNLEKIKFTECNFANIVFSNCPALKVFEAVRGNYPFDDIEINDCDSLYEIRIYVLEFDENVLSSEELAAMPSLRHIRCSFSGYKKIDLSGCEALISGSFWNSSQLESVILKNVQNRPFEGIGFHECPKLFCIEVDDPEYMEEKFGDKIDDHTEYSEDCSSSVSESNQSFELFPNPAQNTITLDAPNILGTVRFSDIYGKTMTEIHSTRKKEVIDISDYPAGTYFVEIGNNIEKFIKE